MKINQERKYEWKNQISTKNLIL